MIIKHTLRTCHIEVKVIIIDEEEDTDNLFFSSSSCFPHCHSMKSEMTSLLYCDRLIDSIPLEKRAWTFQNQQLYRGSNRLSHLCSREYLRSSSHDESSHVRREDISFRPLYP